MPSPFPPKAAVGLRLLSFFEDVEHAHHDDHPARNLTKRESACRDAVLDMFKQWFHGEIDLEKPVFLDVEGEFDDEEDGEEQIPVGVE